ncbi:hypothetical protein GCT13_25000 [Paraburkholderia sp. CNPSo 3157]|uniref:Uncharacterized protein n=1 Tax=Paraburkholderia franconis TaxID=2654983 RepID=A0A7X1NDP0_9BURK|nr:hypothetical protein [Paraburkholderia franconis]MPW20060.1 hypothetical protein [Paraburkholderia franconis]
MNLEDDTARMYVAKQTRPLAHWHDSPLMDAAYRIAQSKEYAKLNELLISHEHALTSDCGASDLTCLEDRPGTERANRADNTGPFASALRVDARTVQQDLWNLFSVPSYHEANAIRIARSGHHAGRSHRDEAASFVWLEMTDTEIERSTSF